MKINDVEVCLNFKFNLHKLSFEIDINECLSNPCPITMKCENTPGSFRCIEGCELGYTWSIKHGQCRGKNIFDCHCFLFYEFICIRY